MTQPQINISNSFVPQQTETGPSLVDLNEVLQLVCNRYLTEQSKEFILRFENLPLVQGSEERFHQLFDALVSMVINYPPYKSKLFLYITCKEQKEDNEVMDLRITNEIKLYKIDVHSNITTDDQWLQQNCLTIQDCSALLQQNGGSFSFFPICNTGCLFSISLPGKINNNAIVQ